MATAYIVDDEMHAALLLKDKLLAVSDYFDNIEIFTKPAKALQAIQDKKPDLIFSDIEMPLMQGVDLHEKIAILDIPFIYVTAYSSYSIQAIKLQAFDYILKPVKEEELEVSIKRFINQQEFVKLKKENLDYPSYSNLLDKQKEKIIINTSESMRFVSINNIVWIEALNNYSNFHMKDETTLLASKTLKHFESQLINFGFIRAHRSSLVNLTYIESLSYEDGGQILLKTSETLDVTREKRAEIKNWFNIQ